MENCISGRRRAVAAWLVATLIMGIIFLEVGCASQGDSRAAPKATTAAPIAEPTAATTSTTPAQPTSPPIVTPTTSPSTPISSTPTPLSAARVPVPPRPSVIADYPTVIASYVSSVGGKSERLADLFNAWNLPTQPAFTVKQVDTDDDGVDELVVAFVSVGVFEARATLKLLPSSSLVLLDRQGNAWRGYLLYPLDEEHVGGVYGLPEILKVADVNKDGRTELVFTTDDCGAHTCFTSVHFTVWDGREYRSLTSTPPTMSYATVKLIDSADKPSELVMVGGTYGSVGAGLQRERAEVYRWDGKTYALGDTAYQPSDYLYFQMVDADRALKEGRYADALSLYRQVLTDDSLKTWEEIGDPAQERRDLRAFARYRVALTQAAMGDRDGLKAAVEESQQLDADHPSGKLTALLAKAQGSVRNIREVCAAIMDYARSHPELLEPLNGYGYANASFTAGDLCLP